MGSDVRFIRVAQPLYVVQMAGSLGPNLDIKTGSSPREDRPNFWFNPPQKKTIQSNRFPFRTPCFFFKVAKNSVSFREVFCLCPTQTADTFGPKVHGELSGASSALLLCCFRTRYFDECLRLYRFTGDQGGESKKTPRTNAQNRFFFCWVYLSGQIS